MEMVQVHDIIVMLQQRSKLSLSKCVFMYVYMHAAKIRAYSYMEIIDEHEIKYFYLDSNK